MTILAGGEKEEGRNFVVNMSLGYILSLSPIILTKRLGMESSLQSFCSCVPLPVFPILCFPFLWFPFCVPLPVFPLLCCFSYVPLSVFSILCSPSCVALPVLLLLCSPSCVPPPLLPFLCCSSGVPLPVCPFICLLASMTWACLLYHVFLTKME